MSGVEILGIAAGVVQIAELGGKLSVKLFTFTRKIKNADRNIDSISQDIAATGAVLQQLGNELKKDEELRLCSPEAVATARSLMEECHQIFRELNDAVDGKGKGFGSGAKVILGLKQRLKYPFLEPQIEMLKANLEKLKSSLLVMLNVLIFAEQLKNQEALPILKEQRELLKSLVEEKIASQKQYDLVLKRLDRLTVKEDNSSVSSLSKETMRTFGSSTTLVNTLSSFSESHAQPDGDSLLPKLPVHLHHRADEIFNHCRLINAVIEEVNHAQYKLDLGIRYRTQEMVMDSHYNEWVHQVESQIGNTEHHNVHLQYDFLERSPELKRHWERKRSHKSIVGQATSAQPSQQFRQQMQAHAQQRQQNMMQQQMAQQQMAQQQMAQQQMAQQHMAQQQMAQRLGSVAGQYKQVNQPTSLQPMVFLDQTPTVLLTPLGPMAHDAFARLTPAAPPAQSDNRVLQSYQMQLMLLEQQNKKRLIVARQQQELLPAGASDGNVAPGLAACKQQNQYASSHGLAEQRLNNFQINRSAGPSSNNVSPSSPTSKRSRACSETHRALKRSKSSNAVDNELPPVDTMPLPPTNIWLTPPKQHLGACEAGEAEDSQLLGDEQSLDLDFGLLGGTYSKDLKDVDFDRFLEQSEGWALFDEIEKDAAQGEVDQETEDLLVDTPVDSVDPAKNEDHQTRTDEKKSVRFGCYRTTIVCGSCRRRMIRCEPSSEPGEKRCQNCIRLKKDCHFLPVDQQRRPSGGRARANPRHGNITDDWTNTQNLPALMVDDMETPELIPYSDPGFHFFGLTPAQTIYRRYPDESYAATSTLTNGAVEEPSPAGEQDHRSRRPPEDVLGGHAWAKSEASGAIRERMYSTEGEHLPRDASRQVKELKDGTESVPSKRAQKTSKKRLKTSLGKFLEDESLGIWADEMEDATNGTREVAQAAQDAPSQELQVLAEEAAEEIAELAEAVPEVAEAATAQGHDAAGPAPVPEMMTQSSNEGSEPTEKHGDSGQEEGHDMGVEAMSEEEVTAAEHEVEEEGDGWDQEDQEDAERMDVQEDTEYEVETAPGKQEEAEADTPGPKEEFDVATRPAAILEGVTGEVAPEDGAGEMNLDFMDEQRDVREGIQDEDDMIINYSDEELLDNIEALEELKMWRERGPAAMMSTTHDEAEFSVPNNGHEVPFHAEARRFAIDDGLFEKERLDENIEEAMKPCAPRKAMGLNTGRLSIALKDEKVSGVEVTLWSIEDFLEKYTLLGGDELKRAREIVE